jgi:GMP reductase
MNIGDIRNNLALNYENIILKHKKCIVSSRSECDISTVIAGKRVSSPVFPSNMKAIVSKDICKIFDDAKWFHIYHRIDGQNDILDYIKRANEEKWYFVSPSVGIKQESLDVINRAYNNGYRVDVWTVDVALSWTDRIVPVIDLIKKLYPKSYLIVGFGDSPDWIRWLEDLGVDCARINVGVSKACRTRQFTGFGSSTATDLIKCSGAANNIKICSDGGLTIYNNSEVEIGGIAKAIRFGADFICSGSLFSRCIDSPSIVSNGYYGNASRIAKGNNHVEGACVTINTNGLTIKETIKLVEESLKSSVSYSGGNRLDDIKRVDYQVVL